MTLWQCQVLLSGLMTFQWQETVALIYESEIVYTTSNPADKDQAVFSTHINYKYQVDGTTLTNTRIYATDVPFLGEEQATALITQYPVGSIQTVFYNSRNPEESVLIKGVSVSAILLIAPTLAFLAIGFSIVKRTREPV